MTHSFIKITVIEQNKSTAFAGCHLIFLGKNVGWCIEYLECKNCKIKMSLSGSSLTLNSCEKQIIKNIIE